MVPPAADALVSRIRVLLKSPRAVGLNWSCTESWSPASTVIGGARKPANGASGLVTPVISRSSVPVESSTTVPSAVSPRITCPKSSTAGSNAPAATSAVESSSSAEASSSSVPVSSGQPVASKASGSRV